MYIININNQRPNKTENISVEFDQQSNSISELATLVKKKKKKDEAKDNEKTNERTKIK